MTAPRPDTPPPAVDRVTLGERIVARRHALNMTSRDLSRRIGRGGSMVGFYEKGHTRPSAKVLARIASALDCSVNDLVSSPFMPAPAPWRKKERKYPHQEGDRVKLTEEAIAIGALERRGTGIGTVTRTPRKADYHTIFVRWDNTDESSSYINKDMVVRIDDKPTEPSP